MELKMHRPAAPSHGQTSQSQRFPAREPTRNRFTWREGSRA